MIFKFSRTNITTDSSELGRVGSNFDTFELTRVRSLFSKSQPKHDLNLGLTHLTRLLSYWVYFWAQSNYATKVETECSPIAK